MRGLFLDANAEMHAVFDRVVTAGATRRSPSTCRTTSSAAELPGPAGRL